MEDEEFEAITVPQVLLAGVALVAIFTAAVVWNAVALTAEAVQAVKHKVKP